MITDRRNKINSETVICVVELLGLPMTLPQQLPRSTITIRAVRNEKQAAEAIKKRCAEIRGMLALRSDLTGEEQERLEAELDLLLDLLKDFNNPTFVTAREEAPAWSSAADLIFDKGLQCASEKARRECEKVLKLHQMAKIAGTPGNTPSLGELNSPRDRFYFEFLARFCETFPEYKNDLLRYDIAWGYRAGRRDMFSALQKQPLCKAETLRFLRDYLEGDDPLCKLTLSECARRMRWLTKENKPDHACKRDSERVWNQARDKRQARQAQKIERMKS